MPFNHKNRKSFRLKEYDYSQEGLYFITICCLNREHLFGNVADGNIAVIRSITKSALFCFIINSQHVLHQLNLQKFHLFSTIQGYNTTCPYILKTGFIHTWRKIP